MRIDSITLTNFKCFREEKFTFNPHFNLFAGINGAGKTSILDGLAVALGIWLKEPPDKRLLSSKRPILEKEIRLQPALSGDRAQLQPCYPVSVSAAGQIAGSTLQWTTSIAAPGKKASREGSKQALAVIRDVYAMNSNGTRTICPVLAYYGAGRAWLPSSELGKRLKESHDPARRWNAFYDAFSERIRFSDLIDWFRSETTAAGNRGGRMRPGFEVMKGAVLRCVPGATNAWYDDDRKDIMLTIAGNTQPLSNLSAGQRMMLALVADLAVRCVTQNNHLVPPDELGTEDVPLPRVLRDTPGVVLIDELDVHLHPTWQRRVAADLKSTFPGIQFICTSHSPQVIGELLPEEVQLMKDGKTEHPGQSFGMDSNWILEVLMGAREVNTGVEEDLEKVKSLLMDRKVTEAEEVVASLRSRVGNSGAIQRAASSVERFKILGK